MGAVLLQDQGNGLQPIAYESKKFSDAEIRWHINEKEAFALVYATRIWRHYLQGNYPVTLCTDNSPVSFLETKPTLTRKQARWMEELAQFDFEIKGIKGEKNMADGLSRRPDLMLVLRVQELQKELTGVIATGYWSDPWFHQPENRAGLTLKEGLWYKEDKVVVPQVTEVVSRILKVLHTCPTAGHRGIKKSQEKVERYFWWP